ncbi:NAD(P)H-dependent oxidoreductase [Cellulophaga baltica]|uniref:NADPH-dependent FMN reductase n=1 Tax=Cellulophaga TaxID=104264 RepID=UPI001C065CF0|nr:MULTISPECIES: NAD(P)H-dependent oxidoreductase [Cellulophaga]MBU2998095.1 NAD(P)H-dependent oxidoreductase [Cellulophaga baltica]MDO6769497.1 NAD(P)H-dependent oxidoreductase [Cellulophaga sp. 1_MG-2023]
MIEKKNIIGICGSASQNSGNLSILKWISELEKTDFNIEIIDDLTSLPHFRTELTDKNVPEKIIEFRNKISNADGIIICTPEYVFSIPSGLKNMIEWCVSTTVFSDKPIGIITASANGEKGHKELKLIMETIQTRFTDQTTLLIQGIKGKIDKKGKIIDESTETELRKLTESFKTLIKKPAGNNV